MAGQVANLESAVEHLEDAVAIVSPTGELLFANPAMRALLPDGGARRDARATWSPPTTRFGGLAEQTLVEPPVARAGVGDVPGAARRVTASG